MPRRTEYPLPRFAPFSSTRTFPMSSALTAAAVPSGLPLSTTTISHGRPSSASRSATDATVAAITGASL